jgi:hypothetical protein
MIEMILAAAVIGLMLLMGVCIASIFMAVAIHICIGLWRGRP